MAARYTHSTEREMLRHPQAATGRRAHDDVSGTRARVYVYVYAVVAGGGVGERVLLGLTVTRVPAGGRQAGGHCRRGTVGNTYCIYGNTLQNPERASMSTIIFNILYFLSPLTGDSWQLPSAARNRDNAFTHRAYFLLIGAHAPQRGGEGW